MLGEKLLHHRQDLGALQIEPPQGCADEAADDQREERRHGPESADGSHVRGGDKAGHWSGAICDRGGVKSSQW